MGLATALAAMSDAELEALLGARPDLADPPPTSFEGLANRASRLQSLLGCSSGLDDLCLQIVNVLALLPGGSPAMAAGELLGPPATLDDVHDGLDRLRRLALVWGDASALHLHGALRQQLPSPAGLGQPLATLLGGAPALVVDQLRLALGVAKGRREQVLHAMAVTLADPATVARFRAEAPPDALELLHRLAVEGPAVQLPYGYRWPPGHRGSSPLDWLHDHGALIGSGWSMAEVPRELGLALRGGRAYGESHPAPPPLETVPVPVARIEAAAAAAGEAAVRAVTAVLRAWGTSPAPMLKAGGLGVRESKRAAKLVDLPERTVTRLLEVAAAGGLVAATGDAFAPTIRFDEWLERPLGDRWVALVDAWLAAERDPSVPGMNDDRDKVVPALEPQPSRQARSRRTAALAALAGAAPGEVASTASLARALQWSAPMLWSDEWRSPVELVDGVRAEAELLGMTGEGALSDVGRAAVCGEQAVARAAAAALLPPPASDLILQADMTCVAPAGIDAAVHHELELLADLESSGAALVYRVSAPSVRRALDAGRSGEEVLAFLDAHAPLGVPQPLAYLVADVARRHGSVRTGAVSSYLRSDDPALVTEALRMKKAGALGLRQLAHTVAVASASPAALLDALRAAGFLPAEEGADGAVLVAAPEQRRAALRPTGGAWSSRTAAPVDLAALVAGLRAAPPVTARSPLRQRSAMPTLLEQIFALDDDTEERW